MITLTAAAHCLGAGCDWATAGSWGDVDKAAATHTRRTQHPSGTMAVMAYRRSEAAQAVERSQQEHAATRRAAASLVTWAERYGRTVDQAITAGVLRLAEQLQQRT